MTAKPTAKPLAWWRVIDWRLVIAAGLPAWALVAGVVFWGKSKCGTVPIPGEPGSVVETAPLARLVPDTEAAPLPRQVNELAELPRLVREDAPPPRAAADTPADPVADPVALLNAVADLGRWLAAPKPVVKIDAKPAVPPITRPVPDGCKTHGTAVHFTRSTLVAMKQAQAKDKLVFVLHLSGNIEDDGFT